MFETRWAKYNDPKNLEWDFGDIRDKWERHAWSAYLDLVATEQERDALLARVQELEVALAWAVTPGTKWAYLMHDDDCEWQFSPRNDVCNCYLSKARAIADGGAALNQGEEDGSE